MEWLDLVMRQPIGHLLDEAIDRLTISGRVPQNAAHYVPRLEARREVARELRAIFESNDRPKADRKLRRMIDRYAVAVPKLNAWLDSKVAEGFTVFALPSAHLRRVRTSSLIVY